MTKISIDRTNFVEGGVENILMGMAQAMAGAGESSHVWGIVSRHESYTGCVQEVCWEYPPSPASAAAPHRHLPGLVQVHPPLGCSPTQPLCVPPLHCEHSPVLYDLENGHLSAACEPFKDRSCDVFIFVSPEFLTMSCRGNVP